jgi:hypothetical protein
MLSYTIATGDWNKSVFGTANALQTRIYSFYEQRGNSYEIVLAETINGLYKAKLIHCLARWKTPETVKLTTLE